MSRSAGKIEGFRADQWVNLKDLEQDQWVRLKNLEQGQWVRLNDLSKISGFDG